MVHPNHEKRAGMEKLITAVTKELTQKHPEYFKIANGEYPEAADQFGSPSHPVPAPQNMDNGF